MFLRKIIDGFVSQFCRSTIIHRPKLPIWKQLGHDRIGWTPTVADCHSWTALAHNAHKNSIEKENSNLRKNLN